MGCSVSGTGRPWQLLQLKRDSGNKTQSTLPLIHIHIDTVKSPFNILYQFCQALFKTFILNIIDLKFNVAVFYIIEGSFLVGKLYLKGQPHAFLDYDKGF